MDAVTALGLAAAVVQFVQFTGGLVSTCTKIFRSPHGASADNLTLEAVCQKLRRLSEELEAAGAPGQRQPGQLLCREVRQAANLAEIAAECKSDCNELTGVLERLRIDQDKNRLWGSAKAALKTARDARKVSNLEKKLENSQRLLAILVGSLIRYVDCSVASTSRKSTNFSQSDEVEIIRQNIVSLKKDNRDLQLEQSAALDYISRGVEKLGFEARETQGSATSQALDPSLYAEALIPRVQKLLKDILEKESELSRECVVVKSLYFHSRPMRHANIPEAYTNTLQWIYDSTLAHWLREKDGMFWVSGKPGSGKSTLMKFMAHHHATRSRLQAWADSQPLVIASHYFWSAGTSMQKSQQGLLQSLLFDIFKSCPKCIPVVCPTR